MAITLDFIKTPSRGRVRVDWIPAGGLSNSYWPTATELNAGQPLSEAISWNDYDFGVQESNTVDDPSFADVGAVQTRGASQYGGAISFYYPGTNDDGSNVLSVVQDTVQQQRLAGHIAIRIDGDKKTSAAWAAGDHAHIFEVLTDGETNVITGEDAFRYTMQMLQQGVMAIYTVVGTTSTPTVVATPATITADAADVGRINVTVNGREWTNGAEVSSDDSEVATIRKGGVWKAIATGTANFTVTVPYATANDTIAVTVS